MEKGEEGALERTGLEEAKDQEYETGEQIGHDGSDEGSGDEEHEVEKHEEGAFKRAAEMEVAVEFDDEVTCGVEG